MLEETGSAMPPYPYTPEEHRNSFVAKARSVEQQLHSLSQELYEELARIWDETDPATHAQAAASMKRLFEEQIARISWDDSLTEAAAAADTAWGFIPDGRGNPRLRTHRCHVTSPEQSHRLRPHRPGR